MLSEVNIAGTLGLSRTPVREAIKMLEQEGLVEIRNRRKYVYVLRLSEIDEIFDLKAAIEGEFAKHAAERHTAAQVDDLRSILSRIRHFAGQNDLSSLTQDHHLLEEWLKLDHEYHHILFEMARNRRAEAVIVNLNHLWHRLQLGVLAMEGRLQQNIDEHYQIAEAILSGRGADARGLMVEHLERLKRTMMNIMRILDFPS